ncbi:protein FAM117B isoform X3 [Leptinotarsa decemlineata]|uniref:protein FAM117B isoform X3 n=1 Tax=Leptinotarsa decemlineata TaxID=7539 RepID=UPI003D30ACCD
MFKHSECVKNCKFLSNTFYNMSGHDKCFHSRILKSSCNLAKHGPMKATIPLASLMKQGNSGCESSASTATFSSIYSWRNRSDPSGQRSPGSSSYKERIKPLHLFGSIRRSVSLDTIYLKGNWPGRSYWFARALQVDKATQTDESDCLDVICIPDSGRTTDLCQSTENTKELGSIYSPGETNLSSSSKSSSYYSLFLASFISPTTIKPLPKPCFRSSAEDLNREIETIVQRSDRDYYSTRPLHSGIFYHEAPDGHRAPLADLLCKKWRSCSVNTQTPEGSQGSSPDQESSTLGPSPQINKFIAREPPDGCEKIQSKTMVSRRSLSLEHVPQPSTFKLKPSEGSAFEPLQPNASNTLDKDQPLVPFEEVE